MSVKTTIQEFGEYKGRVVNKYIITNVHGIQVSVINYGATVTSIMVPGKTGAPADVVLGFDSLEGYILAGHSYIGSICGRYANRISNGRFSIQGSDYNVSCNIPDGCLHGGFEGFDKKYWEADTVDDNGVVFTYESPDGEEGFPGHVSVSVTYRVIGNRLHIDYQGIADTASPINLTSHCYFNLSGGHDKDILDHYLQLNADRIVEVREGYFPTGRLVDVAGSQLDFTSSKKIEEVIMEDGFDYSWVVNKIHNELAYAGSLIHKKSGRVMSIHTTQPAIHFYSGHLLDGSMKYTKEGLNYGKYAGLCLEAQHFPDSPNHPGFPNTIIHPGELYREKTIYSFRIEE